MSMNFKCVVRIYSLEVAVQGEQWWSKSHSLAAEFPFCSELEPCIVVSCHFMSLDLLPKQSQHMQNQHPWILPYSLFFLTAHTCKYSGDTGKFETCRSLCDLNLDLSCHAQIFRFLPPIWMPHISQIPSFQLISPPKPQRNHTFKARFQFLRPKIPRKHHKNHDFPGPLDHFFRVGSVSAHRSWGGPGGGRHPRGPAGGDHHLPGAGHATDGQAQRHCAEAALGGDLRRDGMVESRTGADYVYIYPS